MPNYLTMEEARKARVDLHIDRAGNELAIGDKCIIVNDLSRSWTVGVTAVVRFYDSDGYIGWEFDAYEGAGSNLDGLLPKNGYGYRLGRDSSKKCFEKVVKLVEEADEQKLIDDILAKATKEQEKTFKEGQLFKVTVEPTDQFKELLNPLMGVISDRIKKINRDARAMVQQEKSRIAKTFIVPTISKDEMEKYGVIFWMGSEYLHLSLPFKYRPRFLAVENALADEEIDKEWQDKIAQDVFFTAKVDKTFSLVNYYLSFDRFGRKQFTEFNCAGTLHKNLKTNDFAGLIDFHARYEQFCKVINTGHHPNDRISDDLPTYQQLVGHAHKIDQAKVWNDKEAYSMEKIQEGTMVKVLKAYDGVTDFTGYIGKVIDVNDERATVQFLWRGNYGNSWAYPIKGKYLEILPEGTRRNRPNEAPITEGTIVKVLREYEGNKGFVGAYGIVTNVREDNPAYARRVKMAFAVAVNRNPDVREWAYPIEYLELAPEGTKVTLEEIKVPAPERGMPPAKFPNHKAGDMAQICNACGTRFGNHLHNQKEPDNPFCTQAEANAARAEENPKKAMPAGRDKPGKGWAA